MKISECLVKRIDEEIERLQKIRDKKIRTYQTIEKLFDTIMSFNNDTKLEVLKDSDIGDNEYETQYCITLNRHGDYLRIYMYDSRGLDPHCGDIFGYGTHVQIHVWDHNHTKDDPDYVDDMACEMYLIIDGDEILDDGSGDSDDSFTLGDAIRSRTPNADQLEAFVNQCIINGKLEIEV